MLYSVIAKLVSWNTRVKKCDLKLIRERDHHRAPAAQCIGNRNTAMPRVLPRLDSSGAMVLYVPLSARKRIIS